MAGFAGSLAALERMSAWHRCLTYLLESAHLFRGSRVSFHCFTADGAHPRTPHLATLASMLPGQKFDESRLVKPGDWDKLAADADDDDLLDFEARMESDFAALKAEVAAEKAKGETKSKAAKPKASETTATPQAD